MCLVNGIDYTYIPNADLKNYCTFRVGGKAKHLIIVKNINALIKVYYKCKIHNIKCKIIGRGANLLFDDNGYNGVIIVNETGNLQIENNLVFADSGVNLTNLIVQCSKRNLGGLENLAGIPSTVGGAVVNNSGAFNTNFSDFIDYVECLEIDTGNIVKLNHNQCNFKYRDSLFKNGKYIILFVKLKLFEEDFKKIQAKIKHALKCKTSTQPVNYPSAGSVFKHGKNIPAKIIDELGLKGLRVGDACVSEKHAGFIVNLGSATCNDILTLIDIIKNKVFSAYGDNLVEEIEYVKP